MLRTALVTILTLHGSLAFADRAKTVRDVVATPAVQIRSASDQRTGCFLAELGPTLDDAASESSIGYNSKTLAAASKGLPAGSEVKAVWTWCVKPDLHVRVWTGCVGAGDSTRCALYAAPIVADGKLGKVVHAMLGWAPPKVEDVETRHAPALWTGRGLKVSMEAGRGDGWLGIYVKNGAVKLTKPEWDDK